MKRVLASLLLLSPLVVPAAEPVAPSIPLRQLERPKIEIFEERLESMIVERMRLRGRETIVTDPLFGHRVTGSSKEASLRFTQIGSETSTTRFLIFPLQAFAPKLDARTLNRYLEAKEAQAAPEVTFSIETRAEDSSGPAAFRILGSRAYHLVYTTDGNGKKTKTSESWVVVDGTCYVVIVQAESTDYPGYFRLVRETLNSMHFAD